MNNKARKVKINEESMIHQPNNKLTKHEPNNKFLDVEKNYPGIEKNSANNIINLLKQLNNKPEKIINTENISDKNK